METLECKAAYGSNTLIINNNTDSINVSRNFRIAIRFGFWITILNFVRAVIN